MSIGTNNQSYFYSINTIKAFGFDESRKFYKLIEHSYTNEQNPSKITEERFAQLLYDGPHKLYKVGLSSDEYFKVLSNIPPWAYYIKTNDKQFIKLELTENVISGSEFSVRDKYKGVLYSIYSKGLSHKNKNDHFC